MTLAWIMVVGLALSPAAATPLFIADTSLSEPQQSPSSAASSGLLVTDYPGSSDGTITRLVD